MNQYRFYTLTKDNHVSSGSDLEFADDSAAFAAAMKMMTNVPLEVWQGTRIVFRVSPSDKVANDFLEQDQSAFA